MRRAMVVCKFVVGFLAAAVVVLSATAQMPRRDQGELDAQAWLRKIHSAAQSLNYSGTFVFQQSNQIRTSRITHLFDGKTEREKWVTLAGDAA